MKRTAFALLATVIFASSSVFADDACCAGMAKNDMKGKCDATFASLNLTAAQKSKMEKLAAECDKEGCNAQSMAKMEKSAQKVLNKEQFAAWKAKCSGQSEKKQS
jgi:Spy/CpxP family protein refolding chaperone